MTAVSGGGGQGDVVARAKAALEDVTPGPWEWDFPEERGDDTLKSTTHITPYHGGHVHDGKSGYPTEVIGAVWHNDDTAGIAGEPADLAFITASRSLIPELVAEIERLRGPVPQCSGCGGTGGPAHECLRNAPQTGRTATNAANAGNDTGEAMT